MSHIIRASQIALWSWLILVLSASWLYANEVGERVVKRGIINDDIYLAGGEVELDATVNGDVIVAGGELDLSGNIKGDIMAAGGRVTLRSSVADDARLAGGEIQVLGLVGDDVYAAGGRVHLGRDANVGGRVWLSGGDIRVDSNITQELHAMGGRVRISGTVGGDVYVRAKKIEIDAGAVIRGNLYTEAPQAAQIAEGARIDGEIRHKPVDVSVAPIISGLISAALIFVLSLIITGVVVYLMFPHFAERTTQSLFDAPWSSLGFGLAVFAATPVAIVILLSTGVGIWLALTLLAAYLIMLLLGYLTGVLFIGEAGLRLIGKKESSKTWRAIAFSAAQLLLIIVSLVPLLGGLIFWLVWLAGLGALKRQLHLTYRSDGN